MPELPEVQTVVNTLKMRAQGLRFERLLHLRADIYSGEAPLATLLEGQPIAEVTRRGKRIVLALGDGNRLYFHLGMSGRLTVELGENPIRPHTHFIASFADQPLQLRFADPRRFGGITWLGTDPTGGDMGPEPLTLRPAKLFQRLLRTKRPIKTALLDQKLIAGIGNIYADEALHAAGIHPLRRGSSIRPEEAKALSTAIKRVLNRAIRAGGSSLRDYIDVDGNAGSYQTQHRVYGRAELPCLRCGATVVKITLGGRSTHFCSTCQPLEGNDPI